VRARKCSDDNTGRRIFRGQKGVEIIGFVNANAFGSVGAAAPADADESPESVENEKSHVAGQLVSRVSENARRVAFNIVLCFFVAQTFLYKLFCRTKTLASPCVQHRRDYELKSFHTAYRVIDFFLIYSMRFFAFLFLENCVYHERNDNVFRSNAYFHMNTTIKRYKCRRVYRGYTRNNGERDAFSGNRFSNVFRRVERQNVRGNGSTDVVCKNGRTFRARARRPMVIIAPCADAPKRDRFTVAVSMAV